MFEVTEEIRNLRNRPVHTFTRLIADDNLLEVEAGTNGFKGGDTSEGSRTFIRIEDQGDTDMKATALGIDGFEGLTLEFGGDEGLRSALTAFKFIVRVLEEQIGGIDE